MAGVEAAQGGGFGGRGKKNGSCPSQLQRPRGSDTWLVRRSGKEVAVAWGRHSLGPQELPELGLFPGQGPIVPPLTGREASGWAEARLCPPRDPSEEPGRLRAGSDLIPQRGNWVRVAL